MNAPFQMLRGCRVCAGFESDDESNFDTSSEGESNDEDDIPVACPVKPRQSTTEEPPKSLTNEEYATKLVGMSLSYFFKLLGPARCDVMDIHCIQTATEISNPLLSIAVESKKFSEDALDFLNLTLQWTVL